MRITPEFFNECPHIWKRHTSEEQILRPVYGEDYMCFISDTEYIRKLYTGFPYTVIIDNHSNMGEGWWDIHIDNADMNTVAAFSVQTIEQANRVLGIYNMRLDTNELYFDETWAGDIVIAGFAEPIIRGLLRKTNCHPPEMTWKEWRRILSGIIFSLHQTQFGRNIDAHDWYVKKYGPRNEDYLPAWEAYYDRVEKGLENFGKYFTHLGW